MKSPDIGPEVAPDSKCLYVSIGKINDVFNGMLAPTPEAWDQAISDIEDAMVSNEASEGGTHRLACPVGGCAVACEINISKITTGQAFSAWSGQDCASGSPKPAFLD